MKRFLIATALTASMATSAFAASPAQQAQIEQFLPGADVASFDDAQTANAMNIINSGDSRSTKLSQLKALVQGIDYTPSAAMGTEAEMARLKQVAPEADLASLNQAQLDTALNLLASGPDAEDRVRSVLMDDAAPMSDVNSASEAEMVILERYLPGIEVAMLSEAELNSALAAVYGGGSPGEITTNLQAIVN